MRIGLCFVAATCALGAPALASAQPAVPPEPPTSTSGTGLMPPRDNTPPPAPAAPDAGAAAAREQQQEERIRALEQRVAALTSAGRPAAGALPREAAERIDWLRHFRVSGFVQPQLLLQFHNAADSPNPAGFGANETTARADGSTTNGIFFRLRRARLRTEFTPSDSARIVFEIDPGGGTNAQLTSIPKTIEAVGIARFSEAITTEFAAGVFKPPFGYELVQSSADRPFVERSWGEQNMFPGDYDIGARSRTKLLERRLTVDLAIVNGATQNERGFARLPDLSRGKDLVGRANLDLGVFDLGVSGYYGQGQLVDAVALRYKQFARWAVNGELSVRHKFVPKVGETRLLAEVVFGQNMDRGVIYSFALPAFPPRVGDDVASLSERSFWVRAEQDLGPVLTLSARFDQYSPDTSVSGNARSTIGGVAGIRFTKGLDLRLEYAYAIDDVRPAGDPAPGRKLHAVSSVLQARF